MEKSAIFLYRSSFQFLEKVIDPTEKRKLVSFVDPDARFGRKIKDKKFAGYKAHIVEDESQIVISCETLPGNETKEHHGNYQIYNFY